MTTWRPAGLLASEREPVSLGASLDHVARLLGTPPTRVLTAVFVRWEQLVGADIAAHARPASLRDGVLVVVVDQPAWAAQLRFLTAELLARIRSEADATEVTKIEIRTASPGRFDGRLRRTR